MGGEITWKCVGGATQFELVFYRDCNGAEVNTISETIQVWNHPTLSTITVNFVSRTDISPSCTPVAGSPLPLACGSGANAGNGVGAIEKVIYRSAPIAIAGIPGSSGWIFTYDNFSRSSSITNLQNPDTYGVTISATMFATPNSIAGTCTDNSPQFLQDPLFVSCAGEQTYFNLHPVDIDLDSLHSYFMEPLTSFTGTYAPPSNPAPIPFEPGFSFSNPTPDNAFNAGNQASTLDGVTGEIAFTSNTVGSYVVKVGVDAYQNGILVAHIEKDMQLFVIACPGNNNAPVVNGPFAGSFSTTVQAGTLVNFTLTATDPEFLQDGTPQNNTLTVSSLQFGTNFTSTSGCLNGPCATLDQTPAITGVQGVSTDFSWQTDCAHLVDANGNVAAEVPYTFVFKVQDNYCQIPKVTYRTVTIRVQNTGVVSAPSISCIQTAANGDLTLQWNALNDPLGEATAFSLNTVETGLVSNLAMGSTSITIPGTGTDLSYFLAVTSGCNALRTSDTVKNVILQVFNPANGTANLSWNTPASAAGTLFTGDCEIWREYPTGTWTQLVSLPFNQQVYIDTIDICSAFLNYQIVYPTTSGCDFTSTIEGDNLEDMLTPSVPVLSSVSIDTLTGQLTVNWNQNDQPDTYGYVIYLKDQNGFLQEIDTVWGIGNTSYVYTGTIDGPLTFTVAAFDSCFTPSSPPTYQTSAKGELHTSMFTTAAINQCTASATIDWSAYIGWNDLTDYTVFLKENGIWDSIGNTSGTSYVLQLEQLKTYCVVIRANSDNGNYSFSNLNCFIINGPAPPAQHYLQVATVSDESIVLRHHLISGSNVKAVRFERLNPMNGTFEEIGEVAASGSTLTFTDNNVSVNYYSYNYRAVIIDSCGNDGLISNTAKTILLSITNDPTTYINRLIWNDYAFFDGGVLNYEIYRGINGNYSGIPLAILDPDQQAFNDDVSGFYNQTGTFCYFVIARESMDQYNIQELSYSNKVCTAYEPLVYIPNAFTPDGNNPIFFPVIGFTDFSGYEFSIFDRWGQVVFQTNDPQAGWDGTHPNNGKEVPLGVYGYVVTLKDGNFQEYVYRGHVTVVK